MNVQSAVLDRYSNGAKEKETALCCPVSYDTTLLKLLPQEILDKDYGCGDPSRYIKEGDTVLDLGSGGGKICYIAAQLVGDKGKVIGVDMNDDMLALARKYKTEMADKLGNDRVEFIKGHIEDLSLSLDSTEAYLKENPIQNNADLVTFEKWKAAQRLESPMIPDQSVDLIISNCVLNLVSDEKKTQLVQEIFRVLKPGGRVAISDIISDELVPVNLKNDAHLWSGCISGAFQEQEFLTAFTDAGFLAASYDKWEAEPWQTVEGIEFRSATLVAVRGEDVPCLDYGHALIYRGPFQSITDDENHVFPRGERMAVCERTYEFLTTGPLKDHFIGIAPAVKGKATTWCAPAGTTRPASATKGATHASTGCAPKTNSGSGCC